MSMNNLCSLSSTQWMPMCCTCRWFQCIRYYVGTVISIFKCIIWPILESKDAQHCWIPCFTLGQRVVKKGIKLSLNMAPEAKIAARRLGLRLFLHKITALNAFWDTYGLKTWFGRQLNSRAFFRYQTRVFLACYRKKFKEKEVNYLSAIDSVLKNIDNCTWIGF